MLKVTMIAALVASLAAGSQAQAAQFVQNGDFTTLTNGVGQTRQSNRGDRLDVDWL